MPEVYFYTGYLHFNDFMLTIAPEYRRESVLQSAGSISFPTSPKKSIVLTFLHIFKTCMIFLN